MHGAHELCIENEGSVRSAGHSIHDITGSILATETLSARVDAFFARFLTQYMVLNSLHYSNTRKYCSKNRQKEKYVKNQKKISMSEM